MIMPAHWCAHHAITVNLVGHDGRAGIVMLANLLQQVAGEHAEALGLTLDRLNGAGLGWALARQRIVIDQPIEAGKISRSRPGRRSCRATGFTANS